MFDSYTFPTRRETIQHHEHRAPTDESVRLLKEFEREATEKVISVNRLENNVLKAQWVVVDIPHKLSLVAICRFSLNGKEIRFERELERPYREEDSRKLVQDIIERLAQEITKQLLTEPQTVQRLMPFKRFA